MPDTVFNIPILSTTADVVADTVSGLFSALADAMPQMVWVTDPDGSHFYYNRGWYDYTGLTEDESMGFGFALALHPDDKERTLAAWQEAWENGVPYAIEYRFRRGYDGVYRWFVGRAAPIKDAATGTVRMWVGTCTDIDDSRRALDAESEARESLSLALQAGRFGTWDYDYATQDFTINERAQEQFGVASPTVPYAFWSSLLHEDDRERILAEAAAFLSVEPPYDAPDAVISIGYRARPADNSAIRHLLVKGSRITDASGVPVRAAGVVQDITETQTTINALQASYDELRASRETLALAARTARIGTWEYDAATGTARNDALIHNLFGVSESENLSVAEYFERVAEEDRDAVQAAFADALAGRSEYFAHYRVRRSNNTVRYLQSRATALPGENGAIARLIGITQDITEERSTLNALRESADALRESESRFRNVLSNAPLIAFAVDKNGAFTFSDGAALALIGLESGQVVGQSVFEMYADHPDIIGYLRRALNGEIVSWTATVGGIAFETQCTPLATEAGERDGFIAVAFDVTEKHRATEALASREAQFRFLFDTVASGVVYQDADARILDANAAAEEILGLTLAQMQGRDSFDPRWKAIKEDGSPFPGEQHPVAVALRTGEPVRSVVMGIFHPSEERYRWITISAMPLFKHGASEPHLVYAYFEDRTDQRAAEAALRESEERFRLAAEASRLAIWEISGKASEYDRWYDDDTLTQFRYDERFAQMFDLPTDGSATLLEAFGRVLPDDSGTVRSEAESTIGSRGERDFVNDFRVLRPSDGSLIWLRSTGQMYVGDNDTGRFVGTIQDITAQRLAEEGLRDSEARLRSLVENGSQMVWRANKNREINHPVPGWEGYTGMSYDEYRGHGWINAVHPDDKAIKSGAWDEAAKQNNGSGEAFTVQYRVWHAPTQTWRYIEGTTVPVKDADGNLREWIGTLIDVNDRRVAEEALRESELRYRTLIDVSPQTIWTATPEGVMDYASPSWFAYSGTTEEQTYNPVTLFEQIHEDDRTAVATQWMQAVTTGTPYEFEMRWRGADGNHRWFTSRAIPVRDHNGTIVRWQGVTFDIHDRKEAEAALREEEERFRALADNISQLAWMTDETGSIFWYNKRWFDYTGTTFDEMKGWGWQKIHHPDTVDAVTVKFADHINRGETWEDTFPIRGADGVYRWFLSRAVPLKDKSGKIVRWFGTNTDITDARDASAAVRQSEERFRSLVTATAQIVWTTGADGTFSQEQSAWAEFTGQSSSEYGGNGWLNAIHPDDHEETLRQWNKSLSTQTPYLTEHRLRRKDGEYRYMAVRAVPVSEDDNTVREWVGVHTDINDQKEAQFALSEYATKQARVAETLQRSLLNTPPGDSFPGITVAAHYDPALDEAQVGGDFFDVFALKGGKVALVVGDVTGKGLKAAEHTGQIKYALRAFLRENPDPGDAMFRVNRLLTDAQELDANFETNDTNAMAAVTVSVLETATGRLLCAGGGAEYPQVYRAATGTVEEVVTQGVVVGGYEGSEYETATTTMERGDMLVMATDGITEARRGRRELFGNDGVAATVIAAVKRGESSADAVCAAIVNAAKRFSATGQFSDDVCLVVVERC